MRFPAFDASALFFTMSAVRYGSTIVVTLAEILRAFATDFRHPASEVRRVDSDIGTARSRATRTL
jgi:hypothetical protein